MTGFGREWHLASHLGAPTVKFTVSYSPLHDNPWQPFSQNFLINQGGISLPPYRNLSGKKLPLRLTVTDKQSFVVRCAANAFAFDSFGAQNKKSSCTSFPSTRPALRSASSVTGFIAICWVSISSARSFWSGVIFRFIFSVGVPLPAVRGMVLIKYKSSGGSYCSVTVWFWPLSADYEC